MRTNVAASRNLEFEDEICWCRLTTAHQPQAVSRAPAQSLRSTALISTRRLSGVARPMPAGGRCTARLSQPHPTPRAGASLRRLALFLEEAAEAVRAGRLGSSPSALPAPSVLEGKAGPAGSLVVVHVGDDVRAHEGYQN